MIEPSLFGGIFAAIFYAVSVTPSVLPRRWWWHGFVSGIATGIGYALGWGVQVGVSSALHNLDITISAPGGVEQGLTFLLIAVVLIWVLRSVWSSYRAGQQAAELQEMKPVKAPEYLLGLVATAGMFVVVMGVVYILRRIFIHTVDLLSLWIYRPIALAVAFGFIVIIVFLVSNKIVFKSLMALFAHKAEALNTKSGGGYPQPQVPERSGSPASLVPWDSIGGQGRKFICKGPSRQMIEDVTGLPAMEPIRIYAGMPTKSSDLEELADLAIADLERAGGFERSVVLVNTATGSGWVDEWLVQPMEYLTRGDCAVVTMQYSYLFSAALLVSDLTPCSDAGTYLFNRVEQYVHQMPEEKRPLVIVSGESLGAYGSQDVFANGQDLVERADGAIWTGSPHKSKLLRELTAGRHGGSPEVAPVYDSGKHMRFVNNPEQLTRDRYGREFGRWDFPRIVFAQHASDPVVWYDVGVMVKEPDWIRERAGLDVPVMHYTPFVTYLQLMTDLPVAGTAPAGHGHTYHRELVDVWLRVLGFDEAVAQGRLGSTSWLNEQMKIDIGNAIETDNQRDP
ncbi:alpha/beta-hydrolase family protein [Actinomyces minihominis]|uniref:alpha/beta-hydrolase family protein n=1 Tax=Actinomyces minihominis TaxID=2002838 RepID=UPI000C0686AC|nr:alpha/beta-hydrolase family protein [Actinomyces minihominis]